MTPNVLFDIKKTNSINLVILNGSNESNWALLPSSVLKLIGFKVPSGIPAPRNITFRVRTLEDPSEEYNVVEDRNGNAHLTLATHDEDAFGGDALKPLTSFLDGFHEVKITISGVALVSDTTFILSVPSSLTE